MISLILHWKWPITHSITEDDNPQSTMKIVYIFCEGDISLYYNEMTKNNSAVKVTTYYYPKLKTRCCPFYNKLKVIHYNLYYLFCTEDDHTKWVQNKLCAIHSTSAHSTLLILHQRRQTAHSAWKVKLFIPHRRWYTAHSHWRWQTVHTIINIKGDD